MVVVLTVLVLVLFAVAVLIAMGERKIEREHGLGEYLCERNVTNVSNKPGEVGATYKTPRIENHGAGRVRK